MNEEITQAPKYWLPDNVYTVLKWIGLACLPTLSWLYNALGQIWNFPYQSEITMTLGVCGTAIAVLIGASQLKASSSKESDKMV